MAGSLTAAGGAQPEPNGALAQRRLGQGPTPYDELGLAGLADWPQEVAGGVWTHPLLDSRGNLRAVVSASGVALERRAISATGLPLLQDPATGSLTGGYGDLTTPVFSPYTPHLLTGHHWDENARWHYARHRWISPWTYGRFTSHSPLTYPVAELNYEWVLRNPWDYVDPDGLFSWFTDSFSDLWSAADPFGSWTPFSRSGVDATDPIVAAENARRTSVATAITRGAAATAETVATIENASTLAIKVGSGLIPGPEDGVIVCMALGAKGSRVILNSTDLPYKTINPNQPTRWISFPRDTHDRLIYLGDTIDRIKSGGIFPHRNDGAIFHNRPPRGSTKPLLPSRPVNYYREYVHPTPGISGPGPQRIVVGQGGEWYYTPDHYNSFIPLNP